VNACSRLRDCQPSNGEVMPRESVDIWGRLGGWANIHVVENRCLHARTILCVRRRSRETERDGGTARPVRRWATWWNDDMINPNALRKIVG
jgi:hypothetical protein